MAQQHYGTMGFSYPDWVGVFYPAGSKPGDYLTHYARYFDAVELDTTFYAIPPVQRVQRWAEQVPPDFLFCAKAPRTITHEGPLGRPDELLRFVDVMRNLEQKLAVVLLQLPPTCAIDQFPALEDILRYAPREVRLAVEFRNSSWGQPRTLDLLREHRAALVCAEYLDRPGQIHVTADFLYIRGVGQRDRFTRFDREQADIAGSLEWWRQQIEQTLQTLPAVKEVFGFFNNNYSGYSVATAHRFKKMMGCPAMDLPRPQPTLF